MPCIPVVVLRVAIDVVSTDFRQAIGGRLLPVAGLNR